MASPLSHSTTANSTGAVSIAFGAAPLGGFNASIELDTATSCTAQLQVRLSTADAWLLADTITLPDPSTGVTIKNVPVYPAYSEARWNITAISGGQVKLKALGVGL